MHAVTGEERVVAGRYVLRGRIGRGAMGTVWRARDPVLARDVAVKEIQVPGLLTTREREVLQERTLREARAAARLNHPGVVTVYDVVEADGSPWIVMELVQARSLEQVLAEDGPLAAVQAAEVGLMVLGALACAHAAGIMHRDVKPSNVLISGDGRAVLTDFGIATLEGDPGLTQVGMVMGTPGFCAPERIRGEPATPASDLWSLGATLFAAVEGHGPFSGRSTPLAVLAAVANEKAPPARSAGPLAPLITALLSHDPAQRPDSATADRLLAAAIRAGTAGTAGQPAQPGPPTAARAAGPAGAAGLLSTPPAAGAGPAARELPVPAGARHSASAAGARRAATAPAAAARHALAPPPVPSRQAQPPAPGWAVSQPARPGPPFAGPAGQHARTPPAGSSGGRRRRPEPPWGLLAATAAVLAGLGLLIGFLAAGSGHRRAATGTGQAAGAAGRPALPPGYRWLSVPTAPAGRNTGVALAVPAAWQVHRQGLITGIGPAGGQLSLTVNLTRFRAAALAVEAGLLERRELATLIGYQPGALQAFRAAGGPAVTWAYRWDKPGTGTLLVQDVLLRLPGPAGPEPVTLRISAPPAVWPKGQAAFQEALRTLRAQA